MCCCPPPPPPKRYFLLGNLTAVAKRALSDSDDNKDPLPADSPLRGYLGAAAALTPRGCGGTVAGSRPAVGGGKSGGKSGPVSSSSSSPGNGKSEDAKKPSKKRRRKRGDARSADDDDDGSGGRELVVGKEEASVEGGQEGERVVAAMNLEEIGGRLARLLMVVRMVEEQSDLSAYLVPVRLSLPAREEKREVSGKGGGGKDLEGDASSSEDEEEEEEEEGGKGGGKGKGGGVNKSSLKGKAGGGDGKIRLAIERLRYHKKVCMEGFFCVCVFFAYYCVGFVYEILTPHCRIVLPARDVPSRPGCAFVFYLTTEREERVRVLVR